MTEKEEGELRERSGADSLAEGGELGGAGQVAEDLHGGTRGLQSGRGERVRERVGDGEGVESS